MKNNETGEYELVVGNPQLLSAFFIVALLCGVAFAMGYVVGSNASHGGAKTADTAVPATTQPVPESGAQAATSAPAQNPAAAPVETAGPDQTPAGDAAKPAEPPPQPTTQAARETPPAPAAQAPDAPAGSYWQVAAYKQASDAQPIMQTLKDGSMPVILRQGPDGLMHVLVGPYSDTQSLSRAKNDLQTRFGIPNPIRK